MKLIVTLVSLVLTSCNPAIAYDPRVDVNQAPYHDKETSCYCDGVFRLSGTRFTWFAGGWVRSDIGLTPSNALDGGLTNPYVFQLGAKL